MIKLDDNLLNEIGLAALPAEEKKAFLKHMYETLEMRVGTRLAERMSEQQMTEFEQFINTGDEQGAFRWLEANFPDYKQVVAEEFDKLKGEIAPLAPQILASSPAPAAQPVQGVPQGQPMQQLAGDGQQAQGYAQPQQPATQQTPPPAYQQAPQQQPYQQPVPQQPQPQQWQQPQPPQQGNGYQQPQAPQPQQQQYPQQDQPYPGVG